MASAANHASWQTIKTANPAPSAAFSNCPSMPLPHSAHKRLPASPQGLRERSSTLRTRGRELLKPAVVSERTLLAHRKGPLPIAASKGKRDEEEVCCRRQNQRYTSPLSLCGAGASAQREKRQHALPHGKPGRRESSCSHPGIPEAPHASRRAAKRAREGRRAYRAPTLYLSRQQETRVRSYVAGYSFAFLTPCSGPPSSKSRHGHNR